MAGQRFRLARHLVTTHPWDFFMMVEMAPDRIYHGLWSYTDPTHPKYEPGNPYENAVLDLHRYLDEQIGKLIEAIGPDVPVLIVSDHGAKKMDGGICINDWLIREGWLTLEEMPSKPTRISQCKIDWSRTRAWGEGGYYGRVFLNVEGREPQGIIPKADYEAVRDQLKDAMEALPGPDGKPIGTRVLKPEDTYRTVTRIAPDLIVYWGDLDWRSVGQVGMGGVYTFENDTGPDDANHDYHGIFIMHDPANPGGGRRLEGLSLMDVAPTVLAFYGIRPEPDVQGKRITW